MIRHLNPVAFRRFGTILPEKSSLSGKPNHHSIYLNQDVVSHYRTAAPVWVGAETGLVILSVSSDGERFEDYYLDRAVRLKGGIWFSLVSLQGRGAVQMGGSSFPTELGSHAHRREFTLRPRLQVQRLYTLFYQEKEAGFLFPGEAHPMAELLYVDQGELHSVADGQDLLLKQGELVLYGPDQWHMQYAEPTQAPRMVTISFDAVGVAWEQLSNRRFLAKGEVLRLLQQILREQERGEENSPDRIFALLTLLLLSLHQQSRQSEQPSVVSGENAIITRAQQYVKDHVRDKLTVPVVAEGTGVSASYLTALFHKHLQIPPAEYIRRIKLQDSKQLIREGQMNVTQIAEVLQYSTVHHFSRQFKQMFGMTPTEYAKSVR